MSARLTSRERHLAVLVAAIEALHQPTDEEVESWADDGNPDEHDARFPECVDPLSCPGHTYTIQVCRECGCTTVDGESLAYRRWPCPTLTAARLDVVGDE